MSRYGEIEYRGKLFQRFIPRVSDELLNQINGRRYTLAKIVFEKPQSIEELYQKLKESQLSDYFGIRDPCDRVKNFREFMKEIMTILDL